MPFVQQGEKLTHIGIGLIDLGFDTLKLSLELLEIFVDVGQDRAELIHKTVRQDLEVFFFSGLVTLHKVLGEALKPLGFGDFHRFKCYTNKSVWVQKRGRGKPHRASQSYRYPWAVKNRAPLAHRSRFGHGANGSRIRFDRPEGRARWICYVSVLS